MYWLLSTQLVRVSVCVFVCHSNIAVDIWQTFQTWQATHAALLQVCALASIYLHLGCCLYHNGRHSHSCSNTLFMKCLSESPHQSCTVFSPCRHTACTCYLVLCFRSSRAVAHTTFDCAFGQFQNVLFVIVLFQQPLIMPRQQHTCV